MGILSHFKRKFTTQDTNDMTISIQQSDDINSKTIQQAFTYCQDVDIQQKVYSSLDNPLSITMIQCEGLIDKERLHAVVLPRLKMILEQTKITKRNITTNLKNTLLPPFKTITKIYELNDHVFTGDAIIYFVDFNITFAFDTAQHPQRDPEEPNTEISIKGPRDGFIEELSVNVSLVRKRLKTSSLKIDMYKIGKRSLTNVALLYMEDIINSQTLKAIKDRFDKLKEVDALYSSYHLQDLLSNNKNSLVPLFNYTGRPDFVSQSLLQGRFAILMDGVPTAIMAPSTSIYLSTSSEDNEFVTIYVSLTRLLRFAGLFIATFLPGFWVALVTFHQDQIPYVMLGTLSETRKGVPFPSPVEAFIMLILFELFREAGLRLPAAIAQTLTVIGGLIIGQAAIKAGITNPAMVVVMAASFVATFTIVDQSLIGTVTIFRLIVLLFSSFLGMFGEICIAFIVFIYLTNVRSFNMPFLAPLSPFSLRDFLTSYLSVPWNNRPQRTKLLRTKDTSRQD